MISAEQHFQKLAHWISLESAAERQRIAERLTRRSGSDEEKRGETLLDLVIADHRSGLGGRSLITFVKRNRTIALPWNRFRVGSPVVLTPLDGEGENLPGVVSARTPQAIEVAFEEWPEGDRFRLDLSADEVTRARQLAAINAVIQARGRTAQLRDLLLEGREPIFREPVAFGEASGLNSAQKEAVAFALSAADLAIIHGPPGTGKTTTVVELIRLAVARGWRVLACAPSNTGVDNLLERLVAKRMNVVRIGHPARVQEDLQSFTLDGLAEQSPHMEVVREMLREAEQLSRKASRYTRAKPAPGMRQDLRREARQLREQARIMEKQSVDAILDRADVVCATTTFDPDVLRDRRFDLAVVDEACQSTESGCWPVVLRADRIVLAGDHCQLPPTVLSVEAAREGMAISLMERLIRTYGPKVKRQLEVQYRMHQSIMRFSSQEFYDETLVADPSVAEHQLDQLPGIVSNSLTDSPVLFVDTAGAGFDEELEPDGESRRNPREGKLVLAKVCELCEAGLAAEDIAVIAPYAAQVRWLREHATQRNLEIDTVDGFQGREKEAVIISLVRSNTTGEIGFLGDTRRMNVALTRARRKLIVIGDSSTLGANPFFAKLLEYFESTGGYRSIWEELTT